MVFTNIVTGIIRRCCPVFIWRQKRYTANKITIRTSKTTTKEKTVEVTLPAVTGKVDNSGNYVYDLCKMVVLICQTVRVY